MFLAGEQCLGFDALMPSVMLFPSGAIGFPETPPNDSLGRQVLQAFRQVDPPRPCQQRTLPLVGPITRHMAAAAPDPSHPIEINPDVARASILELETRLDTTRVLDIFTMKPKPCKLQMSKPNPAAPLSFVRAIRFEADVVISFVPKSTESEVVYKTGYMVMLTDLFLICERMGRGAVSGNEEPSDGQDLWLCFPPLAARHLKVVEDSSTQSSMCSSSICLIVC